MMQSTLVLINSYRETRQNIILGWIHTMVPSSWPISHGKFTHSMQYVCCK